MSPASPSNCHRENSTSNTFLDHVRAQDEDAWLQLTELYGPLIYHWCRKAGLAQEDSADVLQDVFRSVLIHVAAFEKTEASGSFCGWLWSITRNKIRDHFKVQSGKPHATGGTAAYQKLVELADEDFLCGEDSTITATGSLTYRALNIIRGEVKETTWLAFWRSTIDDVSPAAVAQELGISVESVWQSKSRVLRRARQLLE